MRILSISAACLVVFSAAVNSFAQVETNSTNGWSNDFLKTNGEDVIIDNNIMVKTNSPLNTDEFKQFKWQEHELFKIMSSGSSNAIDLFVERARSLSKEYPKWDNGYDDMMIAIEDYDYDGKPDKARSLANELIDSSAPEQYKIRSKGFLNRLDSFGKPISLQFTAVDGREANLTKLRGKVVLVDFWATWCGPCVKEIPNVKAAYDKFHGQGFEVIGISCDTDKERLNKFLKEKGILWPQYFDGKQQGDNKFTVEFGVDGIPHMFLVDKKGLLRFDNVRAYDKYHPKGETIGFEETISKLLAE